MNSLFVESYFSEQQGEEIIVSTSGLIPCCPAPEAAGNCEGALSQRFALTSLLSIQFHVCFAEVSANGEWHFLLERSEERQETGFMQLPNE